MNILKTSVLISFFLLAALSLRADQVFSAILESDAATVLSDIKHYDKRTLQAGLTVAQKVLAEREKLSRTRSEWVRGICGAALIPVSLVINPLFLLGISTVIGGNLMYGYWYMGPQLRLDRAKIIASAFERELARTK